MSHFIASRRGVRHALTLLIAFAVAPSAATAAPLAATAQPLSLIAAGERPSCDDRYAPRSNSELTTSLFDGSAEASFDSELFGPNPSEEQRGIADEFEATGYAAELRPSILICSPTFAGVPGSPTGITAEPLNRSRVAPGWREVGTDLMGGGALRAGDTIELPAVDAATRLRVSIATEPGGITTPFTFTDLSVRSTLTVGADTRGLIARLQRHGGELTELVSPALRLPNAAVQIAGTFRKWEITSQHLPGTAIIAGLMDESESAGVRASAAGTARFTLAYDGRTSKRPKQLMLMTSNYDAQAVGLVTCDVSIRKRTTPKLGKCKPYSGPNVLIALLETIVEAIDDDFERASLGDHARRLVQRFDQQSPRLPTEPRIALTSAVTPDAAPAQRLAGVSATPRVETIVRSGATVKLKAPGFQVLHHDLNGDRQPEFWSDLGGFSRSRKDRSTLAGYLFVSSPKGLVPRRVVIPDHPGLALFTGELSSIADITGDGLGELVVDLEERHAIIPGSRGLGAGTSGIVVRSQETDSKLVVTPSLSSPGAPYHALDDVTGDGRRELFVLDDHGAGVSVASQQLRATGVLDVPAATDRNLTPEEIWERHNRTVAPKGEPAVRVIGGRVITTRWEQATAIAPGKATFAVLDARGEAVQPPVTLTTATDATLLDYDRLSGDLLVWITAPACGDWDCRQAVVRLGADGSTKQLLQTGSKQLPFSAPSARFIQDGPDADSDVELVVADQGAALRFADSGLRGELRASQLGTLKVDPVRINGRWYATSYPARPIPIVAADGTRTVVLIGTRLKGRRSQLITDYPNIRNSPLVLRW